MGIKALILFAFYAVARGQEQICCEGIGCFSTAPPFDHLPLPSCPITDGSNNAPNFNLFTRANRTHSVEITRANIPSQFVGSKRTVFIIHGWNGNRDNSWMHTMKDAFLDNFDYNVIVTGWGAGAETLDYWYAASNTRVVGAEMAYISSLLITSGGAAANRMWCVGHSLGAHCCGHFGKRLTNLGRATGLDPAGPWFDGYDTRTGLWNSDANFVDTIITDKGVLGTDSGQRGKANFFPNGGTGDHGICRDYFTESLSSACRFNARQSCTAEDNIPGSCSPCGGICQVMGEPAEGNGGQGMFHLTTNSNPPHCQG